jgi:hypothetical protein
MEQLSCNHSRTSHINAIVSIGMRDYQGSRTFPPSLKDSRPDGYKGPLYDYHTLPSIMIKYEHPDYPGLFLTISVPIGPSWFVYFLAGDSLQPGAEVINAVRIDNLDKKL